MQRKRLDDFQVLNESRVLAKRHISDLEKKEFCERVRQSIEDNTFEIIPRNNNLEFIDSTDLEKRDLLNLIYRYIDPSTVVAVIPDAKFKEKELWICDIPIPAKEFPSKDIDSRPTFIYLKADISGEGVKAISFHECFEKIHVDYSQAEDFQDNSYLKEVIKRWLRSYKKDKKRTTYIVDTIIPEDPSSIRVTFQFKYPLTKEDAKVFFRNIPYNIGLDRSKVIRSAFLEEDKLTVSLKSSGYHQ